MALGGDLVFRIMADRAQFDRSVQTTRSKLGSLAGFAKKTLGGIAIAYGGAFSIEAADQQAQAEKKLAATLKATGYAAGFSATELKKFAAERQKLTNFGDEETINLQSLLTTFKNLSGEVFKETTVLAQDMSAVMGQDLKSSAIQLGKALNDPIVGLTALSRVGVTFNEQQKEQIRYLQESGNLMEAQKVILSELRSEFGGAAEEMASPWQQMKNELGDTAENVGAVVMPAVQLLNYGLSSINTVISDVKDEWDGVFGNGEDDIAPVIAGVKSLRQEYEKLKKPLEDIDNLTHMIAKNAILQLEGRGLKNKGVKSDDEFSRLKNILDSDLGGERLELFEKLGEELDALANPADSFQNKIADLYETMQILQSGRGIPGVEDSLRNLKKILEDKTGVSEAIKKAREELEKLTGDRSEIDQTILDFAAKGAPQDKLLELRELLQEKENQEGLNDLRDFADITKEDLDPFSELDKKTAKLDEAYKADLLDDEQFAKALEKARGEFERSVAVKPEYLEAGRDSGPSDAINAGTQEFNRILATALTGRDDEQKRQTKNLDEIKESNRLIATANERIESLLRKNRVITKPDGP